MLGIVCRKYGRVCCVRFTNNIATGVANSNVTLASALIPAEYRPIENASVSCVYNDNTVYNVVITINTNGDVMALVNTPNVVSVNNHCLTYFTN